MNKKIKILSKTLKLIKMQGAMEKRAQILHDKAQELRYEIQNELKIDAKKYYKLCYLLTNESIEFANSYENIIEIIQE